MRSTARSAPCEPKLSALLSASQPRAGLPGTRPRIVRATPPETFPRRHGPAQPTPPPRYPEAVASSGRARAREAASSLEPHIFGRTPAGCMTRVARREDGLLARQISDQSPGLSRERLVERMRMPGLRRNGLAALRAHGAQRQVALGAKRAALNGHARPRRRARRTAPCATESSSCSPSSRCREPAPPEEH